MKFSLIGRVDYAVGSCHDDRSVLIRKRFSAPTKKAGVTKAKAIIREHHDRYSHLTDYGLWAKLLKRSAVVWKTRFREDQPNQPKEYRKYLHYLLVGHIWWIGPGRSDYNDNINEEIRAADTKNAIEQAKEILKNACKKRNCPRNCSVNSKLYPYEPSHEIGTFDRWDVIDKKGYRSGDRLSVGLIPKKEKVG